MKKLIVLSAVFASLTFASCNDKKEETKEVETEVVADPAAETPNDSVKVETTTTTEVKTDSVKQ